MWKVGISILVLTSTSSLSKPQLYQDYAYGPVEMSPGDYGSEGGAGMSDTAPLPFLAPLEMGKALPGGDYGLPSSEPQSEQRAQEPLSGTGTGGGNLKESHGSCSYKCDGWPFKFCTMSIRLTWSQCINPYDQNPPRIHFNGQKAKYSNYPTCASVPDGCNRCDDECAIRDGRSGKDDY